MDLTPFCVTPFCGEGQFVDDRGKRIVGDWENGELISINDDGKITDE